MFMEKLTNFLAYILRPILRPVSHWLADAKRKRPTWHYEGFFVGSILLLVAYLTSPSFSVDAKQFFIGWLSAFAVMGSFLHAKVGYRMSEAMEEAEMPDVYCYDFAGRYWVGKEILWFFVFLLSGAYPAIVGNIVFILYPAWRKIHIKERKIVRGKTE